jgi:hypothetical protein
MTMMTLEGPPYGYLSFFLFRLGKVNSFLG